MIYGYLNQGSGLGNQLHRYIATRIRALDLGVDWKMIYSPDGSGKQEGFKGKDFIDFNENKVVFELPLYKEMWHEKKVVENGIDIRPYDPEFNFIKDKTIIEGEFQDERYWEYREKEVDTWLKVKPLEISDDVCVIGFRGGEYSVFPDLFLPKDYWKEGIKRMKEINPNMRFEVHTDDGVLAKQFFPNFNIIQDVEINWRSMRYAKYAIIANSSFYILPRWLSKGITFAPRYWARYNIHKIWALPQNFYKRFLYI